MPTTYTLSYDFGQLLNTTAPVALSAYVQTNLDQLDGSPLITSGEIRLGGGQLSFVDKTGVGSVSLVGSDSTDLNVPAGSLQYQVVASYVAPGKGGGQRTWLSGWFTLTANSDLSGLATTGTPTAPDPGTPASLVDFTPSGTLTAGDVQAALVELDGEKIATTSREQPYGVAGLDAAGLLFESRVPGRPDAIVPPATGVVATDTANLQAALATGGHIVFPPGLQNYVVNATLKVGAETCLRGRGRTKTTIQADAAFAGPLVELGTFASRVEALRINSNDVAGSTGVRINEAQEHSGLFEVLVTRFTATGIEAVTTGGTINPQNYSIDDVEVYASGTGAASTIGVHIKAGTTAPRILSRITVNVQGLGDLPVGSRAFVIETARVPLRDIGIEHFDMGVELGNAAGSARGATAVAVDCRQNVEHGVVVHSGSFDVTLAGISNRSVSATATVIEDLATGTNYTNEYIPLCVITGGTTATRCAFIAANGSNGGLLQAPNPTFTGTMRHTGTAAGFNGATAVGKRTLGAAATDAATTQTLANNLRQALIDLGLGQA